MDKQELLNFLFDSKSTYIIFDEPKYNPIEIIILTDNKRALVSKIMKSGYNLIESGEKKRVVTVLSYKEIGAKTFREYLLKRAQKVAHNVWRLAEEDKEAFLLLYLYVCSDKDSWLRQNIVNTLLTRKQLHNEEQLIQVFTYYLNKNNVRLSNVHKSNMPTQLKDYMSCWQKAKYYCYQFFIKLKRHFILRILRYRSERHSKKSPKEYLDYIKNCECMSGELTVLNCKGASANLFIKQENNENTYFIKGNGVPVYNGLANEIKAQKLVEAQTKDKSWYLPMVECDVNARWIKYPFVTWPTLDAYLGEGNILSREQRQLLGENLVLMLDELKKCEITHNDVRPNNILVKLSEDNQIEKFVLTDFGCACAKNDSLWKEDNVFRSFFLKDLCGTYRYNEKIVDDAASAYLVYIWAGGLEEDKEAEQIKKMIGASYYLINKERQG